MVSGSNDGGDSPSASSIARAGHEPRHADSFQDPFAADPFADPGAPDPFADVVPGSYSPPPAAPGSHRGPAPLPQGPPVARHTSGEFRPEELVRRSGEDLREDFVTRSGEGQLDVHGSGELYLHRSGEGSLEALHRSGEGSLEALHRSGEAHLPPPSGQGPVPSGKHHRASRRYSRSSGRDHHDSDRRSGRSRSQRRGSDRGRVTQIGPYRLLKRLGKGSHGYVYLAQKEGESRQVALKFMRSRMLKHKEAFERFRREAELASKLQHPGVLNVLDTGQDGEQLYYAMEYCPGHTLQEYLQRLPMEPGKARKLVAQLARTVAYAHEQGVIHRDIKPSNILLDPETNHPRITDFGLAKDRWEDSDLTQAGEQIGTPIYMSPEQFRGQDVDHRADIYSLGVVLYECLTGRPPYEAATTPEVAKLVLAGKAVRPSTSVPGIPAELEAICLKAMSKEWVSRYAKASDMADALEQAKGAAEQGRKVGLLPLMITLAFVGLALGIVIVTWLDTGRSRRDRPGAGESPTPTASRLDTPIGALDPSQAPAADDPQAEQRRRAQGKLRDALELSLAELPFDQNLAAFDEAVELAAFDDGLRARAELERASYLFRRGRFERCNRAAAVLARRSDPIGVQARYLEAFSDLLRGRTDYAIQRFERLAQDDAEGSVGKNAGAMAALHHERSAEAELLAREALRLDPANQDARLTLAMAQIAQDRPTQALGEIERVLEAVPDHPRAYLLRGRALEKSGQRNEAYSAYTRLIALTEPEPPDEALRRRAALACRAGRSRQAIEDTQRLIKRDPLDTEARLWMGVAYEQMGKLSKAHHEWEIAYETEPRAFDALLQRFDTQTAVRIRSAVLGD